MKKNKDLPYRQNGFIDPISLISLGFLIIGLVVSTVIVKNPDTNLDIRNWAAFTSGRCSDGSMAPDGDTSYCPSTPTTKTTVASTAPVPVKTTAPTTTTPTTTTLSPTQTITERKLCAIEGGTWSNNDCVWPGATTKTTATTTTAPIMNCRDKPPASNCTGKMVCTSSGWTCSPSGTKPSTDGIYCDTLKCSYGCTDLTIFGGECKPAPVVEKAATTCAGINQSCASQSCCSTNLYCDSSRTCIPLNNHDIANQTIPNALGGLPPPATPTHTPSPSPATSQFYTITAEKKACEMEGVAWINNNCIPGQTTTKTPTLPTSDSALPPPPPPLPNPNGFIYYSQNDPSLNVPLPGGCDIPNRSGEVGDSACGPAAAAMIIASNSNPNVNPLNLVQSDYPDLTCEGSSFSFNLSVLNQDQYGLEANITALNENKLKEYLQNPSNSDNVVFVKIVFNNNTAAHYTVITGVNDNGEYIFNDPYFGQNITDTYLPQDYIITNAAIVKPKS